MERLMQYVWQHRLLVNSDLFTTDGRKVIIVDPGRLNTSSGPDFFNAKVYIGDQLWAGDIEIHVKASNWFGHGHHGDPAYDSVVLHVVDRDDTGVTRTNGETIPQMVMQCAPEFHRRYATLTDPAPTETLPCAAELRDIPAIYLHDWLGAAGYERVYAKAGHAADLAARFTGDWEEAAYVLLARALGFNTNSDPMERLALSMPLRFLRKHSDSLFSIEALFFGQSGLLDDPRASDDYASRLRTEYGFLAHKFSLRPLGLPGWKRGGVRPASLPHRRIALLAAMVAENFHLMDRVAHTENIDDFIEWLRRPLTGYWADRFGFGAPGNATYETISRQSASILAINVAVPLAVAYGTARGDEDMIARGVEWLHSLPAEKNRLTTIFGQGGLYPRDAFDAQAMIQIRRAYCERRACILCRIGHRLLSQRARRRY
ncbi:MAG: DUF2851 family protein [Duncaniella sp.]|nr:DUF2851 family protein [Duncaniella sp.]